jgi:hypothetical protein
MKSNKPKQWKLKWDLDYQYKDGVPAEVLVATGSYVDDNEKILVIEKSAYDKAIKTLKKIANEDFRGNRPQSAVDAYNTLKELGELDEQK